jgi:tellurite resistance protein
VTIEVAPRAVASVAYVAIYGDRIDPALALLGGYGPLMVLALLGGYGLLMVLALLGGYGLLMVLAAISVLIGGVAIRTLVALARRQLLPHPAAAPVPAVPAASQPGG